MEELRELNLNKTSIREFLRKKAFLTNLEIHWIRNYKQRSLLPDSIGSLTKLRDLNVEGCVSLIVIPMSFGKLQSLSELELRYTNANELPKSVKNLKRFKISGTPMERLQAAIGMLKELGLFDAEAIHGITKVPTEIGELSRLIYLHLGTPISRLLDLPSGSRHLGFSGCSMESLPNISNLTNFESLSLNDLGVIRELPSSLIIVFLHGCDTMHTLPKFSYLKHLSILILEDCTELMDVNALVEEQSLREPITKDCEKISKLSSVRNLLTKLSLNSCSGMNSLPNLLTFKNLIEFSLIECNNVIEIQGLDTIESLCEWEI